MASRFDLGFFLWYKQHRETHSKNNSIHLEVWISFELSFLSWWYKARDEEHCPLTMPCFPSSDVGAWVFHSGEAAGVFLQIWTSKLRTPRCYTFWLLNRHLPPTFQPSGWRPIDWWSLKMPYLRLEVPPSNPWNISVVVLTWCPWTRWPRCDLVQAWLWASGVLEWWVWLGRATVAWTAVGDGLWCNMEDVFEPRKMVSTAYGRGVFWQQSSLMRF